MLDCKTQPCCCLAVQATIVKAVLPLWSHPQLSRCSFGIIQHVITILTDCSTGTSTVSAVLSRASSAARPTAAPDPAMVQNIVDMGFPRARVEETLRRVSFLCSLTSRFSEQRSLHVILINSVALPLYSSMACRLSQHVALCGKLSANPDLARLCSCPQPLQMFLVVSGAIHSILFDQTNHMSLYLPSTLATVTEVCSMLCV